MARSIFHHRQDGIFLSVFIDEDGVERLQIHHKPPNALDKEAVKEMIKALKAWIEGNEKTCCDKEPEMS